MTRADGAATLRVTSADGTEIACWASGQGPPLLLVHGLTADHTRWRPLLPHLEPHATVYAMDRRGRGASGDGTSYQLERECEDVAAVVDTVSREHGSMVDLYGHSFGGLCAFGAAALTRNVRRMVLYEGWPATDPSRHGLPPGIARQLEALLDGGDHDGVIEVLFRGFGATDDEIHAMRAQPAWRARVAAAPTIPRELRATGTAEFTPARAAQVMVPTMLLTGSESPDPATADLEVVRAALPDARVVVMPGQSHLADVLAPAVFARYVLPFLRVGSGAARGATV